MNWNCLTSKTVLSEEEYEERLRDLIKHEYFPDLVKLQAIESALKTNSDLLKSERSGKSVNIEKLLKKLDQSNTNSSIWNRVNEFLATHISEDNLSFIQI